MFIRFAGTKHASTRDPHSGAWEPGKCIHETIAGRRGFAWQTGYGASAVSFSHLENVNRYIADQVEHHKTRTFQDEFRALLRRHGIAFDEWYVWD